MIKGYPRQINDGYEVVKLDAIKPHPRNPRRGDLEAIKASVDVNGFYGAVVANKRTGYILAGNHRWMAANALGLLEVPVVWVDVGKAEARRILAADNRTSDLGSYDDAVLASLLQGLQDDGGLLGTGYDDDDLAGLLSGLIEDDADGGDDETPAPAIDKAKELEAKWKTSKGQVWKVGAHRLMCGDCRSEEDVKRLVDGVKVNLAFTSPPYASQRKYDEGSGFKPIRPDDYVEWFDRAQACVRRHLADDGSWFVNIKEHCEGGQRHLYVKDLTIAHVRRWGWRFVDELCWRKTGMPGSFGRRLRNDWEPVFHFDFGSCKSRFDNVKRMTAKAIVKPQNKGTSSKVQGTKKAIDSDAEGVGLSLPGNVIELSTAAPKRGMCGHSAAFPVSLPTFFIKAYTDPGDVVYDPFMGSGTTAIAAEQEGRRALGMEISPAYLAVQLQRFADMGLTPELIEEG